MLKRLFIKHFCFKCKIKKDRRDLEEVHREMAETREEEKGETNTNLTTEKDYLRRDEQKEKQSRK